MCTVYLDDRCWWEMIKIELPLKFRISVKHCEDMVIFCNYVYCSWLLVKTCYNSITPLILQGINRKLPRNWAEWWCWHVALRWACWIPLEWTFYTNVGICLAAISQNNTAVSNTLINHILSGMSHQAHNFSFNSQTKDITIFINKHFSSFKYYIILAVG